MAQRHISADTWPSNSLDLVTDVDGWEHTVSTNNGNPDTWPFYQYGNYKSRHVFMAEISEIPSNFLSNCQLSWYTLYHWWPCHSAHLEAQLQDDVRYLDTLDETLESPHLFAVHNQWSMRTRKLASSIVLPSILVASLHPDPEEEPVNSSANNGTNNMSPRDSKPSTRDSLVL